MKKIYFDHNQTRLTLYQEDPDEHQPDWLFLPGGPGADSAYYLPLLEQLKLPGRFWLIDLPNNGNNKQFESYDFENWQPCFLDLFQRYKKPILVGHSFGGMYPLLFPELEHQLNGLIILNSAPCLWQKRAAEAAQAHQIQPLNNDIEHFLHSPSADSFKKACLAQLPFHFPEEYIELGRELFSHMDFNYHGVLWWTEKSNSINFSAQWIPQQIPTLIVGGELDFITPFSLFQEDERFKRKNIQLETIAHSGHFSLYDHPEEVARLIERFSL